MSETTRETKRAEANSTSAMRGEPIQVDDDRIEKVVDIHAPPSRVWRALTDHREFGTWFMVDLDGPFEIGETTTGVTTYPGYEGQVWRAVTRAKEPVRYFAFAWEPYELTEAERAAPDRPETLVEFRLEPIEGGSSEGTRLTISESGFSGLADEQKRLEALRSNTRGWDEQAKNIAEHVEADRHSR